MQYIINPVHRVYYSAFFYTAYHTTARMSTVSVSISILSSNSNELRDDGSEQASQYAPHCV
jgi:hypothetical protein